MIITAYNKENKVISQIVIVEQYIKQKRWDVLSAGITRLINEIKDTKENFDYVAINDVNVIKIK